MYLQIEPVRRSIDMSLKVIRMYDWLLDLYVLDFFVDNHWDKIPASWREIFQNIDPQQLGHILSRKLTNHVFPLSFLALMSSVNALSLPRKHCLELKSKIDITENFDKCGNHPRLKNLFLKHVKLKKRHEICLMADVVNDTAVRTNCSAVIDFGSGLGHLVRMLAYKNDFYAAGIECQNQLTEEARSVLCGMYNIANIERALLEFHTKEMRKLDIQLEYTASKHLSQGAMTKLRRPIHYNITLSCHRQLQQLPLPEAMRNYGLIGLHPCGDLGPLLLKHFVNYNHVKFICVVGCCYMKLSCGGEDSGYPMSGYVKRLDSKLSYTSREIACHAIDVYCERLSEGNYENLKVHAYRAALERILVEHDPKLKHAPVRSIKHSESMTFERYCLLAVQKLDLPLSPEFWSRGLSDLKHWRRVVTVYTLRLALAPLVETLILLDRVLYVLEHGLVCEIHPVFDPKLSPRNHIVIARRL